MELISGFETALTIWLVGFLYCTGKVFAEAGDPAMEFKGFGFLFLTVLVCLVAWPLTLGIYSHDRDIVYWEKARKTSKKIYIKKHDKEIL